MKIGNLFEDIPADLPTELFERLGGNDAVTIERIVSRGHTSPPDEWYEQERDEWVMVLQGGARLLFDEGAGEVDLRSGDYILIPAHRRHRVVWTEERADTIWLAVHFG